MSPKTDKKGFKEAYDNLPCKMQRIVRKELMDSLEWGQATFYSRMRGESFIRQNEIKAIELVFSKRGIDAWTGQTLFFK